MTITVLFRTVIDTYANGQVRMFTIPWLDELNSDMSGAAKHADLKPHGSGPGRLAAINRFIDAELGRVHVVEELPDYINVYQASDSDDALIALRVSEYAIESPKCPLCGSSDRYANRDGYRSFKCCEVLDYYDTPAADFETYKARREAYRFVKLICEIHGIERAPINRIILEMLGEEIDPPVLHRLSESKAKRAYALAPEAVKEFIRRVQEKNRLFEQGRLSEFL